MKKVMLLFLCLTIVVAMTACASENTNEDSSAEEDKQNVAVLGNGGTIDVNGQIIHVITGDGNGIVSGNISSDDQDVAVTPDQPDNTDNTDAPDTCEHIWEEATCYMPEICCMCGATQGEALGHTGGERTCIQKARCSRCGESYGEFAPHTYHEPSCYSPAFCTYCGESFGSPVDHKADKAPTCTQKSVCVYCKYEIGDYADHNMVNGTCTVCGYSEIVNVTVTDFYASYPVYASGGQITGASYSVQGSDLYITVYGNRIGSGDGQVEFGWIVYGGGYQIVEKGNSTISVSGNTFSGTIVVSGVITSDYSSYKVWVGLPNLT